MGGITVTQRFEIAKIVLFRYPRWPPGGAILKFFKWHHLSTLKSDWAETWWEASQWHRDSKLLKLFHSDIQDGCHSGILKFFKQHLLPNPKSNWWEASQWHRDSKLLKWFRSNTQNGRHGGHLEIHSNDISSQTLSVIELKLNGRHHSDTVIQNC